MTANILENQFICYCHQVTEAEMLEAIHQGARTLNDIRQMTGACVGGNCKVLNPQKRCCSSDIQDLLKKNIPQT